MFEKAKVYGVRAAVLSAGAVALPAFATGTDTTAITAAITDAGTAGATIGAAVVVMLVGIKVFKWIRRAL